MDEVLGSSDARLRVSTLPSLDGLRLPVDRNDVEWRLHPLVREYCATRFAVEDPVRKRLLHTRIARVLARRGHLGPTWRHATAAGDDRLVGDLIENVGAFGLWLREGLSGLAAAGQSWRRMEALSCARVALLVEQDDLRAADELASALRATAAERGMTRTAMRALGLSVTVAHRAGREDRALSRLVECLRLMSRVDYVRPLVSQGETTRTLLRRLLGTNLDVNLQEAAETVLSHFGEPSCSRSQQFTPRELDVLAEVRRGHQNKAIAGTLGITDGGVRYHLKNIYRKTGVSRRLDAVRYAEEKGILG